MNEVLQYISIAFSRYNSGKYVFSVFIYVSYIYHIVYIEC